jgi:hypothetical protein
MRFIRTGVAVALVLAALTIPLPHAASDAPAVTLTGLSAIEEADVRWAVGLFDQAGLRLPPIEVVRHRSVQPCSGRRAAHTWKDGRSTIHLCADDKPRPRRYRMLHEIAHAWDRQSLTEARRAAFLDLHGLEAAAARLHRPLLTARPAGSGPVVLTGGPRIRRQAATAAIAEPMRSSKFVR